MVVNLPAVRQVLRPPEVEKESGPATQ